MSFIFPLPKASWVSEREYLPPQDSPTGNLMEAQWAFPPPSACWALSSTEEKSREVSGTRRSTTNQEGQAFPTEVARLC